MIPLAMIGAAVGTVGSIGSGIIGDAVSKADRAKAAAAYEDAANQILQLGAPPDVARQIILDKFQQAGVLNPQLEQNVNLEMSKMSDVQENEKSKQAKLGALSIISQRAQGGLTPEDRAAINKTRAQIQQDSEGKQQAILQSYAQKGMSGAGNELAARLISQQGSANQAAQQGDELAATASRNALSAAGQLGTLGTQISAQDFGMDQAKAQAADAIAKFNAENAVSRQTRNVQSQNQAQATNIGRQQAVSDANIQSANAEKQREVEAQKWMYGADLGLAQAKAGALEGVAGQANLEAKRKADQWAKIGQSFSQLGSSMTGGMGGGGGIPGMGG